MRNEKGREIGGYIRGYSDIKKNALRGVRILVAHAKIPE